MKWYYGQTGATSLSWAENLGGHTHDMNHGHEEHDHYQLALKEHTHSIHNIDNLYHELTQLQNRIEDIAALIPTS